MKKCLSFCFILFSGFCWGQSILSATITPNNPTTVDTIRLCTHVYTTSNAGTIYTNFTQNNDTFHVERCMWMGGLTITQDHYDAITLGVYPAGNYHVNYKVYRSDSFNICTKADSTESDFNFSISSTPASISDDLGYESSPIIRNDYSFTLSKNAGKLETVFIYNELGSLVSQVANLDILEGRISSLPPSFYLLVFVTSTQVIPYKFSKQ